MKTNPGGTMKVRMSCRHLVNVVLLLAFASCCGAQNDPASSSSAPATQTKAQTTSQEKPRTVYESSTVLKAITRLVVVDVVATDKNERAVTDLKPGDFTILEDGVPQQIRGFSFQRGGTLSVAETKPAPRRALPPNIVTNIPEYASDGSLNVLLLDSLNTLTLDQITARDHALRALEQFPPGRAVAVYSFKTKLQVLHDFTNDHAELKKAIENYKAENSILLENPTNGPKIEYVDPALEAMASEAEKNWAEKRMYSTLDAMSSLARALAGYPGRKNLIWISGGFPQMGNIVNKNYTAAITRTADLLSNAQIAVYPIDARGAGTSAVFTAQNGKGGGTGPGIMAALSKEAGVRFEAHGAMRQLADLTGGKTFFDKNDLDHGILRSMDDGSTYYTLGYYPLNKKWNGKFRTITVTANRPGITLRYRTGYLATDSATNQKHAEAQRAEDFGQALSLDFPVSTSLLFQAGILKTSAGKHGKVAVNFLVDAHQIGFEKQSDGLQHATLDYAVEVYSEKGKQIKTDVTSVEIALPQEPFKQVLRNGLPYQKTFDLPPGNYILRLGIRDNRTGLIGSGTGTLSLSPMSFTLGLRRSIADR
jgi:VWFA-related protein